jgi:hypothetical protein
LYLGFDLLLYILTKPLILECAIKKKDLLERIDWMNKRERTTLII